MSLLDAPADSLFAVTLSLDSLLVNKHLTVDVRTDEDIREITLDCQVIHKGLYLRVEPGQDILLEDIDLEGIHKIAHI